MKRKSGSVVAGTILTVGLILVGVSFILGPVDFHGFDFGDSSNYQNEYTEIFSNLSISKVYVDTINGSVHVEGWENDYIQLEVKQRYTGYSENRFEELFKSTKPEVTFLGDYMRIITPRLKKTNLFKSYGVSIIVKVPHNLVDKVEAKTSNGSLYFSNLNARIVGKTSNGSIYLLKTNGNAELDSSNGKVYASEFTGNLNADTSNASIEVENSQAQVYLKTSNGSIYIRSSSLLGENNTLKTSNGKVVLDSELPGSGQLKLSTSNGGIELTIPHGTGAIIDADTSNGRIILDNVPILTTSIDKTSVSGSIYGGGNLYISLNTSNSNIKISEK